MPKILDNNIKKTDANFIKNNLVDYHQTTLIKPQKYQLKKNKFKNVKSKYLQENRRENLILLQDKNL